MYDPVNNRKCVSLDGADVRSLLMSLDETAYRLGPVLDDIKHVSSRFVHPTVEMERTAVYSTVHFQELMSMFISHVKDDGERPDCAVMKL